MLAAECRRRICSSAGLCLPSECAHSKGNRNHMDAMRAGSGLREAA